MWHIKRDYALTGIAAGLAVRSAGTGAANLQGRNARKATLASIGERAKCVTE